MKRTTMYISAALTVALATVPIAGCGGQQSASESTEAAASSQATDEIVAEFNQAVANVPAYKSVTITDVSTSTFLDVEDNETDVTDAEIEIEDNETDDTDAEPEIEDNETDDTDAEPETYEEKVIYKFDASGDKLKTSSDINSMGVKMQYYTDGDDAVFVSDGPVYSGTTEEFELWQADGVDAYITNTIGDLSSIGDLVSSATKEEKDGITTYTLELDPQKYTESDELLGMLAEYGETLQKAVVVVGFDKDGRIVHMENMTAYADSTSQSVLDLADFDTTVIDPMPEATKTYADMEADMDEKLGALDEEIDLESLVEDAENETEAE